MSILQNTLFFDSEKNKLALQEMINKESEENLIFDIYRLDCSPDFKSFLFHEICFEGDIEITRSEQIEILKKSPAVNFSVNLKKNIEKGIEKFKDIKINDILEMNEEKLCNIIEKTFLPEDDFDNLLQDVVSSKKEDESLMGKKFVKQAQDFVDTVDTISKMFNFCDDYNKPLSGKNIVKQAQDFVDTLDIQPINKIFNSGNEFEFKVNFDIKLNCDKKVNCDEEVNSNEKVSSNEEVNCDQKVNSNEKN